MIKWICRSFELPNRGRSRSPNTKYHCDREYIYPALLLTNNRKGKQQLFLTQIFSITWQEHAFSYFKLLPFGSTTYLLKCVEISTSEEGRAPYSRTNKNITNLYLVALVRIEVRTPERCFTPIWHCDLREAIPISPWKPWKLPTVQVPPSPNILISFSIASTSSQGFNIYTNQSST